LDDLTHDGSLWSVVLAVRVRRISSGAAAENGAALMVARWPSWGRTSTSRIGFEQTVKGEGMTTIQLTDGRDLDV
jgi:hypothetical protein